MSPLATVASPTEFDRTIALSSVEGADGPDSRFDVDLDAGWSSLVGVHGGYLCAIATAGAAAVVPGSSVRTMTTSFLRPARVGPARLSVRPVRRGRTFATVVTELVQRDRVLTTSRFTLMADRPGAEWREPVGVDLPPVSRCVPFTPPAGLANFGRFELRFDPDRLPFDADRARVCGYVRPLERRPVDAAWLAMAVDCFPPPAFARLEPPAGGMSIDLTTHVHADHTVLDPDEWLVGEFEIRDSTGGLAVEHGHIARTDGTVLAESFHTRLMTG